MTQIIVLFGGRGNERHVSVASAQNLVRTIPDVLCWFWSPTGAVHDVGVGDLLAHQRPFELDYEPARPAIFPTLEQALDTMPVDDPIVLLALHGGEGEDGTVQRALEQRGLPFTGSGSEASAKAFDKGKAKKIVRREGVRMAESIEIPAADAQHVEAALTSLLSRSPRAVLKPLSDGSSRGLYFVDRGDDLGSIASEVAAVGVPYLAEQFIAGREITVAVIGQDGHPRALPCLEIETDPGHVFDYAGKYLGKGTREICPANIPAEAAAEAQRIAVAAHTALGCEGYSRSDLVLAPDGSYYLETNTLPGLTSSSLVPQQLAADGIAFEQFLRDQIEMARRRDVVATARPARTILF
jgi:D-alanine-D-alanine ligase